MKFIVTILSLLFESIRYLLIPSISILTLCGSYELCDQTWNYMVRECFFGRQVEFPPIDQDLFSKSTYCVIPLYIEIILNSSIYGIAFFLISLLTCILAPVKKILAATISFFLSLSLLFLFKEYLISHSDLRYVTILFSFLIGTLTILGVKKYYNQKTF